jgi:hypothetical protein
MKKISFCIVLAFSAQFCFAQSKQAEIEKKMKEAQKEIDKMKNDPKYKDIMKNMPNMDSVMKKIPNQTTATVTKTKISDTSFGALPKTDTTLLRSLPLRTFTKAELVSYLHNLNVKLTEILRTSYGTDIKNIPVDYITMTGSSIALWINGQPYESVLVALKGAEMRPDNITLLNNIGGILTSSGLAVNAIPVLQYADQQQPGNNMIQNNLGLAYFGLGDFNKAEHYLLQSISTAEYYPDANLALAYIYNKKGNKAAAINYAENSLRGAYSADAQHLLLKLKPDAKLMDYVRHRYKQPEFFNYHKYPLLPQCVKVNQAAGLKPKYDAYQQTLGDLEEKYSRLSRQEGELGKKTATEKMMQAQKTHRSLFRYFGFFANAVLADLWANEYENKFLRYDKYKKNYRDSIKILDSLYDAGMKAIADKWNPILNDIETGSAEDQAASKSICNEKNELGNAYLPQYASLTEDFQLETIKLYRNYLNDWSYWSYLASVDDHSYKAIFYQLASTMVLTLKEINITKFILPCHTSKNDNKEKADVLDIEEPDCFFKPKVVLPLGGVNFEISCEGYKLEAGEGLIGKIEYNMSSGDVTVAFGVGAKAPKLFFHEGGVEAGGEAEVKSQFFITFNKGTPIDCGVLWEAEIKAKIGLGAASEGDDAVETTIGVEEGLTAGFGSGVQMKEGGPLKYLIDKMYPVQPDAKQINKNIPLYKK